ncbi:hypothetical protein DICA3_A01772 [Diutina catenulata]
MLSSLFLLAAAAAFPAKTEMISMGHQPADIFWVDDKILVGHYGKEHDYGLNNNCRVLEWGGAWNTPDGSHKKNALVECLHKERKVAYDVRKIGRELDCTDNDSKSLSCSIEHTDSESTSVEVSAGIEYEGFSAGSKFSSTKTTSDSLTFSATNSCDKPGRSCEIGGKAMIEYDMYIGWVHWDSWRNPDQGKGPQWINADNDNRGMWDFRTYQKHAYDADMQTGWYHWAGSDDDCNVYGRAAEYASKCQ